MENYEGSQCLLRGLGKYSASARTFMHIRVCFFEIVPLFWWIICNICYLCHMCQIKWNGDKIWQGLFASVVWGRRYQLRIKVLEQARCIEELFAISSFHYEVLKGDKAGISSIRVSDQYRIEFTVEHASSESVITICNILDLSNHYK